MLKNLDQEHILLVNEQNEFELLPCQQIENVANGSREVRAFILQRKNDLYVVYWHISGDKKLEIPLKTETTRLFETLGKETNLIEKHDNAIIVPVGGRRYLQCGNVKKQEILLAFENARVMDGN